MFIWILCQLESNQYISAPFLLALFTNISSGIIFVLPLSSLNYIFKIIINDDQEAYYAKNHSNRSNQPTRFDSFPSSTMLLHARELLHYEPSETKVYLKTKKEFSIPYHRLLVIENQKEESYTVHVFQADEVEQNRDQYRYYAFSYHEAAYLHSLLSSLFK